RPPRPGRIPPGLRPAARADHHRRPQRASRRGGAGAGAAPGGRRGRRCRTAVAGVGRGGGRPHRRRRSGGATLEPRARRVVPRPAGALQAAADLRGDRAAAPQPDGQAAAVATAVSPPRPLLLLDSPSLAYRAFFALPASIRSPSGQPVNAVRGYLDMVSRLLTDRRPTGAVHTFDADWRP